MKFRRYDTYTLIETREMDIDEAFVARLNEWIVGHAVCSEDFTPLTELNVIDILRDDYGEGSVLDRDIEICWCGDPQENWTQNCFLPELVQDLVDDWAGELEPIGEGDRDYDCHTWEVF